MNTMLRRNSQSSRTRSKAANAPRRRPGASSAATQAADSVTRAGRRRSSVSRGGHPLCREGENRQLFAYEQDSKTAFDNIVPVLKQISALQHDENFERSAQDIASRQLGFELPADALENAWVDQLDMKRLYAWSVFETYRRYCDDFYGMDPLHHDNESNFDEFTQSCGFHTVDVSPCADGRLAHVIRYVLRLPHKAIRRKSYAGATFDIEDSIQKWVEIELQRFREGLPNTADQPTRYLKVVTYHLSSVSPATEGCAAHGSDTAVAAKAGLDRLIAFKQAIENSFCCGASIDLLLLGVDTDTDSIRVHVPSEDGTTSLDEYLDVNEMYRDTERLSASDAITHVNKQIRAINSDVAPGMATFIAKLIENNFSQIAYVKGNFGSSYSDAGHAERFIGAGVGFEEIQLRNLMYFAYLNTVEEATADLDVGLKIFTGLNIGRGLPVPVVIRFDHHSHVPGARERAIQRCAQVSEALQQRYSDVFEKGLLHILQVTRDCDADKSIEILQNSVVKASVGGH